MLRASKKNSLNKRAKFLSKNLFPVVGIGASAGGLDAFKKLLNAIPEKSGMAYILVQHLSPDHDSSLPEILQRETMLPVHEISNNVEVEPNHIYIIPSNKLLMASDGILKLSPRGKNQKNMPIDIFFTSLADVHRSHAIGVVLSGSGSDGTIGLKSIKDQGGITCAQDPSGAAFADMPKSAIEAEVADFVLPPEKIPQRLLELEKSLNKPLSSTGHPTAEALTEDESYRQVLALLRLRHGVDFNYYKQTTVQRRVLRRMALLKIENFPDYRQFIKDNKDELHLLFNDLLIRVTNFFRDPATFEILCEKVFPELLKNKLSNTIRIWIAGCATGEEAYSMGICLYEYLNDTDAPRVQIFATDVAEQAIAIARAGTYDKRQLEGVSDTRLQQFFTKTDGHYQIKKNIRDMCVFATHNLLKDPPFAKTDLISCRNVMIYMDPFLQKKALDTFHYSLNEKGFLLLGKSESIGNSELFHPFSKKEKIFTRKEAAGRLVGLASGRREEDMKDNDYSIRSNEQKKDDFQKKADDILLSNHTPPGVIVNEQFDVVQFRGSTREFLEPSPGKPNLNVLKMAREGLSFELRNALHKSKTSKKSFVKRGIPLDSGKTLISIEVIPLPDAIDLHFLILFKEEVSGSGFNESEEEKKKKGNKIKDTKDARIAQLEKNLSLAREDMRSITEDQEAANEELQSANEELLSGSEELQTMNEELETSKEELQSTNEELITVNQELYDRNELYNQARMYAEAIVATIHEPLLILDKDFRINSANPAFYKTFQITDEETLGKILFELQNNGWDIPGLRSHILDIRAQKEESIDWELAYEFPGIGKRVICYNARPFQIENGEDRILLAMEDITERKLLENRNLLSNIVDNSDDAIISKKLDGTILSWNNSAEKIFGYTKEEIVGKNILLLIPPELHHEEVMIISKIKKRETVPHFNTIRRTKDGKRINVSVTISPIIDEEGKVIGASKISRDITEQTIAQKKIQESELRLNTLIQSSPFAIGLLQGKELIIGAANEAIINILGKGPDIIGKPYFELMPELEEQGYKEVFNEVYRTGKPFNAVETAVNILRNGKIDTQYYNFLLFAQRNINNEIDGIGIIASEVTETAVYHEKLKESEEQFRLTADLLPDKVFKADAKGNFFYLNKAWEKTTGLTPDELKNVGWLKTVHPDDLEKVKKHLRHTLETGNDCELQFRVQDKTGNYRWHLCRAMALKEDDGTIKMWIGATTDIQEQKRKEEEKSEFISIASHELKTPLTASKLYINLLEEGLSQEENSNHLMFAQKAAKSIERLELLIKELLDVQKIQHGQLDLNITTFDFNEMLDGAIEEVRLSAPGYSILKTGHINLPFKGDKDRLQQVVINLLTNAVKYSPESNKVFITSSTENGMIKVAVKDQGIGIQKENIKKVFDLYYREAERSHPFQGFGIGLSISSEIVKRHNGEIWAESEPGKGSTFYFTIPM